MKTNHQNSYGVFCIAMAINNDNERELDWLWEDAIRLYDIFLSSKFNDVSKSELECINEFLTKTVI